MKRISLRRRNRAQIHVIQALDPYGNDDVDSVLAETYGADMGQVIDRTTDTTALTINITRALGSEARLKADVLSTLHAILVVIGQEMDLTEEYIQNHQRFLKGARNCIGDLVMTVLRENEGQWLHVEEVLERLQEKTEFDVRGMIRKVLE